MTTRFLLLLCATAALAPAAAAQRPARLTVLADSVSAGERVRVAVAVDHGPGQSAVFPDVPAGSAETAPLIAFGDAEAFSVVRLPPVVRGSVRTDSAVYEVAVFAVDTARVGPVPVRLAVGRDTVSAASGVALVPVRSLLTDGDTTPAPLGPPDSFPGLLPVWTRARRARAGARRCRGVVLSAVEAPRRGPSFPAPIPSPRRRPRSTPCRAAPAERALGAREALRVYLARRLGLPALESTADEIVQPSPCAAFRTPRAKRRGACSPSPTSSPIAGIAPTSARADEAADGGAGSRRRRRGARPGGRATRGRRICVGSGQVGSHPLEPAPSL